MFQIESRFCSWSWSVAKYEKLNNKRERKKNKKILTFNFADTRRLEI